MKTDKIRTGDELEYNSEKDKIRTGDELEYNSEIQCLADRESDNDNDN